VGSGPYLFKEWSTGEKVVVEANPAYWEGRPYINRVVYRIIPDQSTIFLELIQRRVFQGERCFSADTREHVHHALLVGPRPILSPRPSCRGIGM
jgi:MarR-like DNA-binding transcriptional regulator SgrR of sgrS sRNA